jgi:hypothetical protein
MSSDHEVPEDDTPKSPPGNTRSARAGWMAGLSTLGAGRARTPEPSYDEPMNDAARRKYMKGLSPLERKWSTVGVVVGLFVIVVIAAAAAASKSEIVHGHKKASEFTLSTVLLLIVMAVLAFLALWAIRSNKRSLATFSIILYGFSFTLTVAPVGLILIFIGGWLILRAWRVQKTGYPTSRGAARASAETRLARKVDRERPTRAKKTATDPAQRSTPSASKRYTPKTPPRKKPPVSS